ncbi:MAG: DNA translocase FtsK 4TM domain-containing protein [Candidatus Uhrbacteria bacterium]
MARKRRTKRTYTRRKQEEEDVEEIPRLSAETRHGIVVVLLFACGIIGALSFAGVAGTAGDAIAVWLRALFGIAGFLVPLLLLILAAMLLRVGRPKFGILQLIGLAVLAVSFTGILHIRLGPHAATTLPTIADGGGYLGLVLATPLVQLFGPIASVVILIALTIIGAFLAFHLSFARVQAVLSAIGERRREARLERAAERYRDHDDDGESNFAERALEEEKKEEDETDEEEEEEDAEDDEETDRATSADAFAAPARRRPRKHRQRVEIPLDLLSNEIGKPTSGDIKAAQEIIRRTLENFRIDVEMADVRVGPTVTQFSLRPADGVKLSRITTLANDLALALAAHPIRIEAPIPGKSLVGIEVPNQKVAVVRLREGLESPSFRESKSPLTIALGKDVAGHVWTADMTRMPHLLVAGATGSGKSVMLNTILMSLLYTNGPDDLKLILVDPKRVEFPIYNGIPHLLTPVITDVKKTIHALRWAIAEMDRRFELLASKRKRDIAAFNRVRKEEDRLPYLVIVVDELADLMAVAASDVESAIIRLAQMARAVGIHLVLATQRPSVDVITGLIKANITSRIAFAVASSTDSRTILDGVGAERLLGRGDMLFTTAELSKPKRIQGTFVSDNEIQRVVDFLREQSGTTLYDDEVTEQPIIAFTDRNGKDDEDEPLLAEAKDVILQAGKASASMLQRRLKIGYSRAARILDILEQQGFIGPADGAKPREVYGEDEQKTADKEQNTWDEGSSEDDEEEEDEDGVDDDEEDEIEEAEYDEDEEEK